MGLIGSTYSHSESCGSSAKYDGDVGGKSFDRSDDNTSVDEEDKTELHVNLQPAAWRGTAINNIGEGLTETAKINHENDKITTVLQASENNKSDDETISSTLSLKNIEIFARKDEAVCNQTAQTEDMSESEDDINKGVSLNTNFRSIYITSMEQETETQFQEHQLSKTSTEKEMERKLDSSFVKEEVSDGCIDPCIKSCTWEIDLDSFKGRKKKRVHRIKAVQKQYMKEISNEIEETDKFTKSSVEKKEIPTCQSVGERKVLDLRRWYCMSRPQYKKSCGISSLVSCWNYLFTTLGHGSIEPITQEEALDILGFKPPYEDIRFGPFTGNATLMRWFRQICQHHGVRGRSYYFYKPKGKCRTSGVSADSALSLLKKGLGDNQMSFIYHCQNHYFCPIGYEDVPVKCVDAYRSKLSQSEVETWILIGEPSRKHPGIHFKRWDDIKTDLNSENPNFVDIRKTYLGIQQRKTKNIGGNLHCILAFQRSNWQGQKRESIKPQETSVQAQRQEVEGCTEPILEYLDSDNSSPDTDEFESCSS